MQMPGGRASQAEEVAKAKSGSESYSMHSRTSGEAVAGGEIRGVAGLQVTSGLQATAGTLTFALRGGEVMGGF